MIVSESDLRLAALDRRLAVDGLTGVDPLQPVSGSSGSPRSSTGPAGAQAPRSPEPADLGARLPLGRVIDARVVEIPREGHVIAEVETLRIELAWPRSNGVAPKVGRDIALRVLAHRPMLLFESVAPEVDESTLEPGEAPRWSGEALSLQTAGKASSSIPRSSGPVRFDVPIIDIEIVPLDARSSDEGLATNAGVPTRGAPLPPARGRLGDTTAKSAPPSIGDASRPIDLDDVIVARSAAIVDGTAIVDGVASPLIPRAIDDPTRQTATFMPLVLQGPAWPGQPMELVVRRERADEQFDNPVLDHWCGEVMIDLPQLGRVAGHLAFSMKGLRIRLEGDDEASVDAMNAAANELTRAFASVDLRVVSLSVGRPAADNRRPDPQPVDIAAATFTSARRG